MNIERTTTQSLVDAMIADLKATYGTRNAVANALTEMGLPISETSIRRWERGGYSSVTLYALVSWIVANPDISANHLRR